MNKGWIFVTVFVLTNTLYGQLVFHHGFEKGLRAVEWASPGVEIFLEGDIQWTPMGIHGRGVEFAFDVGEAALTVDLRETLPTSRWTLAFFLRPEQRDAMMAPRDDLLVVRDQRGDLLFGIDVSGNISIHWPTGRSEGIPCSDALYWMEGEVQHLALTYDEESASIPRPRGVMIAYWNGRPYGALSLDLGDRRPVILRFGGRNLGVVVDEIQGFATALPQPALIELFRHPKGRPDELDRRLAVPIRFYETCGFQQRRRQWQALMRAGRFFEAEMGRGGKRVAGWEAAMASGNSFLQMDQGESIEISFELANAGSYALALRYSLDRRLDPLWPVRRSDARCEWTDNATGIEVELNGKTISLEWLYPTGLYDGHSGDIDPWAWHALVGGSNLTLSAGSHRLVLRPVFGLAWPRLDGLLVTSESGPAPPHPRWVDAYRIPPAWWVEGRRTEFRRRGLFGRKRVETFTISLWNLTDEPFGARLQLESDRLDMGLNASLETNRVALGPHEEGRLKIVVESLDDREGLTGFLRVVLWNEDSGLPMEYRLWPLIPEPSHRLSSHPRLIPPPDPEMQRRFREWLTHRDPGRLTSELQQWAAGPDRSRMSPEYRVLAHRMNLFPAPLLGERLDILDMWMGMSEEALAAYLPRASAEYPGYGLGWDKVNNAVAGHWAGPSFDYRTTPPAHIWKPEGNLDWVTELSARGVDCNEWTAAGRPPPRQASLPVREASWRREQDPDVFASLRNLRWCMMAGMPFGSMGWWSAEMPKDAGIPLLAEAYYLTGDERYAQQAFRMAKIFARAYTVRPRQFLFRLYREDRGWWGSRWHNRYMTSMGERVIQRLGTALLDLCWDAWSEEQRTLIEHNLIRFGMFETTYGPLWDDPDKGAKMNREDPPPFIPAGRVLGDPGPRRGLRDFFYLLNRMMLPDGMHVCSIGTYGGAREYLTFMRLLHELGVDVRTDNPALRNSFLTHPRFVFACGSLQPMDDGGGGQHLLGLDPTFGSPTPEQYAWGYELYGDPLFLLVGDFLRSLAAAGYHGEKGLPRADRLRRFYARHVEGRAGEDGRFPLREIWPAVFVAKEKGMAILRNWAAPDPLDWIEIIYDYGRFGGRFHGHPSKLGILTAVNGQIGSQDFGDLTRNSAADNNDWFMGGYCHNTVQVDFQPHQRSGGPIVLGKLLSVGGNAELSWIDAWSDRLFDGVVMRRTSFVTEVGIVEFFFCDSERDHLYDWPYHHFGVAETGVTLVPTNLSAQGLLRFVHHARSASVSDTVQVTWRDGPLSNPPRKGRTSLIGEEVFTRLWALPQSGTELILFAGPTVESITAEKEIDYALLRRRARTTVFATVLEPWRASRGPKIASVERVPVMEAGKTVDESRACALRVIRHDGKTQVFLVNYKGGPKTVGGIHLGGACATWTIEADGRVMNLWQSPPADPFLAP